MATYASQLIGKVGLEGSEKTKADLQEIGKKAGETKEHFRGLKDALSTAAGFAIFGGVSAGFGFLKDQVADVIKLTSEFEQTQAQTAQVLKSTHDVSGMTAESLDKLAQAYGKTTMFSADTVQSGENLLLTFTNIGKSVFPQATQAILDVSQAMGQDLKSSAIQVGKALGDPLTGMTALQRIGVTFSDKEKEQIKTMMAHNDIIGAQKVILHELATEFGGSATAAGKTFGGQMAILANQFDEIKIKIGQALLPVLNDLLNKYVVPLATRFADWLTKGGGLQDFQRTITNISNFMQSEVIPTFTKLLNQDIIPLAQWVYSLWTDAVNLFQAFQRGEGYANALAIGLGTIGTAIALMKIEDFVAGWVNWFGELNSGAGIIANVATNALPELGQALGWTRTQAEASAVAIEGIGAASVEAEGVVAVSSAGMTVALGVATAGISLLVGAAIAGIAADAIKGQTALGETAQKVYDSLGQSSDDMKAKAQADATVAQVSWQSSADNVTSRWQNAGEQMAKSSAEARAKMVLDQQAVADAAEKAAQRADAAWGKASQDMNIVNLLRAAGWTDVEIARYLGQPVTGTTETVTPSGKRIAAHASGIQNNPIGHLAMMGEGGEPEVVTGPRVGWLPRGASVVPLSQWQGNQGTGNGGPSTIILAIDGVQFARVVMPHLTNQIRYSVGSVGY